MTLQIHDTFARKKRPFEPRDPSAPVSQAAAGVEQP